MTELRFAAFSSQIELPFYSALFTSKLDHDKLDDSARFVLGTYESNPNAEPEESTRMQILGNALTNNLYAICLWLNALAGKSGRSNRVPLGSV